MALHKVSRIQAFTIHLIVSCLILISVTGTMVWFLYPDFYFTAQGGWEVIKILIAVDLVLGPMITLIIFKPGKKGLKFDMYCIAGMQLAALIYGSWIIYQERPAYLVFAVDRFEVVSASEIDPSKARIDELKQIVAGKPKLVFAVMPKNQKEKDDLMFNAVLGGKDLERRPEYYEPIGNHLDALFSSSMEIEKGLERATRHQEAFEIFLSSKHKNINDFYYFPVVGRHKDFVLVVNKQGQLSATIDVDPWDLYIQ